MILQTQKDLSLWNLLVPKHYQSVPKARKVQSFYECPDMLEDSYRYFQYANTEITLYMMPIYDMV